MWKIELPRDFVDSRNPNKSISVLNFKYVCKHDCENHLNTTIAIDETSFHSPTLSDGNFNQDNYICTLCYTYNTVFKSYPIKSNPQYIEFYFKDTDDNIVKKFHYAKGESGDDLKELEERFTIDLELVY